ncbi:sensor histidine kinase [Mucilaginibacter arboris]|uniref:histidine kinase n=1 Tax=Mucilaginibacter arboris TaxID=2682090 RepID=A0A7K1T0H3_9SPHI|nr:PAS domain-containing sensor histidine kinase [Mucilaginibacter arboris]MVN23071.1 PAS domain-containing protein [Mucilaginibacter arboris]
MKLEQAEGNLNILSRMVADHVPAMLAYWDKNLVCLYANSAYQDWFGMGPDEMINNKMTIDKILGPLYQQNLPHILGALAGENQTFEREIVNPKGVMMHSIANYISDIEDGVVKGFFVHVADITSSKLLEKEVTLKNEIINDQNKRLLNFANVVSHNLNTYSNNLKGILDLFENAESVAEKDEMIAYLKEISNRFSSTVVNLNEIVYAQNLTDFAHEPVNLFEYTNNVIKTLLIQIKASEAVVKNEVGDNIIVKANAAYVESIILNLLTNAIKYRQPGRQPVIAISARIQDKEVVLSIKDNGLGINLAKCKKDLFGMYKTFHGNSDANGIGLFITKYQIEAMGGRIEVESEEGVGTTFHLFLKYK